jgi:hypothetical protein
MTPFPVALSVKNFLKLSSLKSRRAKLAGGLFLTSYFWAMCATASHAQTAVFQFEIESTGTAPFDSNNQPGNDSSASNPIVRTQDVISYRWSYAVNGGNAEHVILKATVPPQLHVDNLSPACFASGSSISINPVTQEQNLVCNLGTVNSGSSGNLSFPARVLGKDRLNQYVANGQTVMASGSWQADGIAPILGTAPITTISAAPKVDLRKDAAYVEGVLMV